MSVKLNEFGEWNCPVCNGGNDGDLGSCHHRGWEREKDAPYELMTVREFFEQILLGCFNKYDGVGYFGSTTKQSDMPFVFGYPYRSNNGAIQGHTHVYWYSK